MCISTWSPSGFILLVENIFGENGRSTKAGCTVKQSTERKGNADRVRVAWHANGVSSTLLSQRLAVSLIKFTNEFRKDCKRAWRPLQSSTRRRFLRRRRAHSGLRIPMVAPSPPPPRLVFGGSLKLHCHFLRTPIYTLPFLEQTGSEWPLSQVTWILVNAKYSRLQLDYILLWGLLHEALLIEAPKLKGNNFAPNNDIYFQLQWLLSFLISIFKC